MMRIAYGTMTKSIEDPSQLLLIDLDERYDDLDSDQTIALLEDAEQDRETPWQEVVGLDDVLQAVRGALVSVGCANVEDVVHIVRREVLAGKEGKR